jgi:hypothetical protein
MKVIPLVPDPPHVMQSPLSRPQTIQSVPYISELSNKLKNRLGSKSGSRFFYYAYRLGGALSLAYFSKKEVFCVIWN